MKIIRALVATVFFIASPHVQAAVPQGAEQAAVAAQSDQLLGGVIAALRGAGEQLRVIDLKQLATNLKGEGKRLVSGLASSISTIAGEASIALDPNDANLSAALIAVPAFVWGMLVGTYAGCKPNQELLTQMGLVLPVPAGGCLDLRVGTRSGVVAPAVGAGAGFTTTFVPLRVLAKIGSCIRGKSATRHCSGGCHCSRHWAHNGFYPGRSEVNNAGSDIVKPLQGPACNIWEGDI